MYLLKRFRYTELRLTNQKLTRELDEKDKQLEDFQQKVDSSVSELRKSEKAKKEVRLWLIFKTLSIILS